MSLYKNLIIEVTRCTPTEAALVEETMRDEYRTLDHLTRKKFASEARKAIKLVRTWRLAPAI